MEKLIEKYGGVPHVAPSLKEIPMEDHREAFDFLQDMERGRYDLTILMTGVGLRYLLKIWEEKFSKERILGAFGKTKVVVRGPKPTQVCKLNDIPIAVTVPPPNTWQEILQILSDENLLAGKKVALFEYGISDTHFIAELTARGAEAHPLKIYQWALPDDTAPLRRAFTDIIAGKVDLLLQTSAVQIDHLLRMGADIKEELAFRRALSRVGIFSIGPTTTAHLQERQIFPDFEVTPNKKENLVEAAARHGAEILQKKRARAEQSWIRLGSEKISAAENKRLLANSLMMRACRGEAVERIPVWLMRQAGRYMAEYQLIRRGMDFLDFCKDADRCTEATLGAVERLGVDAAIIFADILLVVEPMGLPLTFREATGPVIDRPVRSLEDIEKLRPVEPEKDLAPTLQAIAQVRRAMHPRIPLIGFCGAPFTLASYMVEGKGSRNYLPTKTLLHAEPAAWHLLMEKITAAAIDFLKAQVEAGCQILQIFDSWVGCLSPADYQTGVLPHMQKLFSALPKGVPTIHFGTGNAALLPLMGQVGGDVMGLDWRVDLSATWDQLGCRAVQGNLDPALLFSPPEIFGKEVERLLRAVGLRKGFIFNLGHGILPETPVDHVMALVDQVHAYKIKGH
jgi:uroporphyrinogen decarboxylase